jgi:hypothetical protein
MESPSGLDTELRPLDARGDSIQIFGPPTTETTESVLSRPHETLLYVYRNDYPEQAIL